MEEMLFTPDEGEPTLDVEPNEYVFDRAVGDDHFIAEWIAYASQRTDAAHDFHEAAALVLLASATPRVRAKLAQFPNGLGTNLYVVLLGDSTTSRKSTSKNFARDVQYRALPNSLLSDQFSPEALVEQLAGRNNDGSTLHVDELGGMLSRMQNTRSYMSGLGDLLMTVYDGADYTHRRHSKRSRNGERQADEDRIVKPHLSILGLTTPAIFNTLTQQEVTSGLLARFGIVMPSSKPPRMGFSVDLDAGGTARNDLVTWLQHLDAWAKGATERPVEFRSGALDELDRFAAGLEASVAQQSDTAKVMLQRLAPMAVKVAMLVAAGRPGAAKGNVLRVTVADAEAAARIAGRWERYALAFASRIGESVFERHLQKCASLARSRGRVRRNVMAQNCHTDKRTLDAIEATLADRGLIEIVRKAPKGGGQTLIEWVWTGA